MTLIMVGTFKDYAACHPVVENAPFKMLNLLAGAGTLCFAWGGREFFCFVFRCKPLDDWASGHLRRGACGTNPCDICGAACKWTFAA